MHDLWMIILFVIVIIILIYSLIKATEASADLDKDTHDGNIDTAFTYITWTVSILWIVIGAIIFGIVALFIFGPEFLPTFGKSIFYLVFFLLVVGVVVVGVISSIAAYHIGISAEKENFTTAYADCIQAAVASLGAVGIFIIAYFITWRADKKTNQVYPEQENGNSAIYESATEQSIAA